MGTHEPEGEMATRQIAEKIVNRRSFTLYSDDKGLSVSVNGRGDFRINDESEFDAAIVAAEAWWIASVAQEDAVYAAQAKTDTRSKAEKEEQISRNIAAVIRISRQAERDEADY